MTDDTRSWLTFDCYDTLVRYTEGKAETLTAIIRAKGGDDAAVERARSAFEASEKELQLGPFVILSEVLRLSLHEGLSAAGFVPTGEDENTLIDAVKRSAPFPDVRPVLTDLKRDHRLAILSNSEFDIIHSNVAAIGVKFDVVVLAAEAKCYKPDPGMFHELLKRIGRRRRTSRTLRKVSTMTCGRQRISVLGAASGSIDTVERVIQPIRRMRSFATCRAFAQH